MSKNTIIKGTLILTIAGVLTKLLGFYNRIFLTRVIGVKELGVYQLIFPIYILAISLSTQGISTAITKHVSYYLGKRHQGNAKKIFKFGLGISLSFSIIIMTIIYCLSDSISIIILKNSDCGILLRIVSIALPFVAVKNCINAYFIGTDNPKIQGISHFFEQLIRVITAYVLTYCLTLKNLDATMATISVVSGEVFSGILSICLIYNSRKKDTQNSMEKLSNTSVKRFLADAIPITSNNLIFTLFASLESIIFPAMLYKYYFNQDTAMELYGIITGIVIPFLLFPATITTSLSTILLPAISKATAAENYNKIKSAIFLCVSFCIILGVVAFLGYTFLGEWACEFAFKSKDAGVILRKMCFLCPFIYINGVLSTILNGIDKAFNNMLINVFGLIIRIAFVSLLVPNYGFDAYILGMFISYLCMLILMSVTIRCTLLKENKNHITN
ncbi:MAG: polysaccharide biosynthesis protein [Lachnospiraceae bacterium]|nr:polysaccharide biosynthesis protein [Lachnospiraceae bacterium]